MKRHYYRLAGESLKALNRLIEYDRLMADFKMTDLRKKLAEILGKTGPEEDPAVLQSTLSTHFTSAQVKGYKDMVGLNAPAVQIRRYGDGLLRRAYHVFPKIAMNPGTSKANFGIGDLFRKEQQGERTAICTVVDDYKGNHYVPPGAIKMTDEEFAALDALKDDFEYYRTYDEGVAMPADFDASVHEVQNIELEALKNLSHVFLVTGEANRKRTETDKAIGAWHMPYQDYRDKLMPPLLDQLTFNSRKLNSWIETLPTGERAVSFTLGIDDWTFMKPALECALELRDLKPRPMDGCEVILTPRTDTVIGAQIAAALATVPPVPRHDAKMFGFDERPSLKNSALLDATMTGFPYMKIERFDGGDVKVLALRLPPNITKVEAPSDCSVLSLDDYKALGGDANDLPTHVFRVEGDTYNHLRDYDDRMDHYRSAGQAYREMIEGLLQSVVPGCTIDEYDLCYYQYQKPQPRTLDITINVKALNALKPVLEDHFVIEHISSGMGYRSDRAKVTLLPRHDTPNGLKMAQVLDAVPYEPSWPRELEKVFGFLNVGGYDQMKVRRMDTLGLNAIAYHLPPFIKDAAPPPDCVKLTKEEFAQLLVDSYDLSARSPLPPRPAHLRHLPGPNAESLKIVDSFRAEKNADGLSLHERTEFSWFKISPR